MNHCIWEVVSSKYTSISNRIRIIVKKKINQNQNYLIGINSVKCQGKSFDQLIEWTKR